MTDRADPMRRRLARFIGPVVLTLLLARAAAAEGTLVLIVGAEGEPTYGKQFNEWADRWVTAASGQMRVAQIGRDASPTTAPTTVPATTQPLTDKDRLQAVLAAEGRVKAEPLWVVFIGHGAADGQDAKFNLRGPDVTGKEIADWLRPAERPVAVINCASASGPFINRLSGPNRVIVTATRSGSEYQFARFGGMLSAVIADPSADLDKDGQTSLFEAFLTASRQTEAFYKQNGRLTTEHALLDDNGDRSGVSADWFDGTRPTRASRTGAAIDGATANQWVFRRGRAAPVFTAEQLQRRQQLEATIESLRQRKKTLSEGAYYAELEAVMLQLAELYR